MIKCILAPTDYSKASLNAIESAINIAQSQNAALKILHVNDEMLSLDEIPSPAKRKDTSESLIREILFEHGINAELLSSEGIVGQAIIKIICEYAIDLVVMGAHGASDSGIGESLIGSNAYYAIKRATCPVLVVPENHKKHEFEKIFYPVRPSAFSLKSYRFIHNLIGQNKKKCTINIFGISIEKTDIKTPQFLRIVSSLQKQSHNSNIEIVSNLAYSRDIAETILQKLEQARGDLIVISPGLEITNNPFFVGPFLQRIINNAKVPVLSILRVVENREHY